MQHRPVRSGRYIVPIGLAAALALGICGSLRFSWSRLKLSNNASGLRALDAAAKPFFDEASRNVPKVVAKLTSTKMLMRLSWLMMKDQISKGQRAQALLEDVLRESITEPCRKGAEVYGCGIKPKGLFGAISNVHRFHARETAFAVGGLTLEALLLKTTLASLRAVLGSIVARLAAAYGGGAACAAADGPFPVGDAVGAVLAVGGTIWCGYDLIHAGKQLRRDLTTSLLAGIAECREACRREVLK